MQSKDIELSIEHILDILPPANSTDIKDIMEDILVYCKDKYDLLPSLILALPPDQITKFIYVFSDTTVKVPDYKSFSNAVRDIIIFQEVKKSPQHKTVKKLAEKYDLTIQATLWIIEKVSNKLEVPNPLKN